MSGNPRVTSFASKRLFQEFTGQLRIPGVWQFGHHLQKLLWAVCIPDSS
jgi:hypothetical protein